MSKLFKLNGILYIIFSNILIYVLLILWVIVVEPLLKESGIQFGGILPTGTLIRGIIAYGCMFLFDLFFAMRSNVRFTVLVWLFGIIVWFLCFMIYTPPALFYPGYYTDILGHSRTSSFDDFLANIFERGTLLYSTVNTVIKVYEVRIIPFIITYIITIYIHKKRK
ncbi:MAG: hypothetical protein HDT47_04680 [Ruminococcaceae bacterium]|nr:hypothetical protein [Oscillospiraceae bacterium]